MNTAYQLKHWLRNHPSPWAQSLCAVAKSVLHGNFPVPLSPYRVIDPVARISHHFLVELLRQFWWTPRFKTRLKKAPSHVYLYSGIPYITAGLDIVMGENCRISGITTFTGRTAGREVPTLIMGNNVGISWQTTLAVGTRIVLADNVRIAGRCFLAGYPGHPINPNARASGMAERDSQVGEIVLEKNVWLGTGCTVLPNVTIGQNSIIGTGSVVTRDIPANVIAAGNPAKVIRALTPQELSGDAQ